MEIDKYTFFIGSNNTTKKREIAKARNLLNKHKVLGFNISLNNGYWNSIKENSFKVEILNTNELNLNDERMTNLKTDFEKSLNQYVVLLEKSKVQILGVA